MFSFSDDCKMPRQESCGQGNLLVFVLILFIQDIALYGLDGHVQRNQDPGNAEDADSLVCRV